MKLLSPAGNFESLKLAVFYGADEVYLGVNEFNARNNIDGFTLETLKDAVDFCHIHGVQVCLAINILFADDELKNALDVVLSAFNLGVDYFIVQDLGLAYLISKTIPNAVLHASTQMAVHNLEGVLALLPYGFKRVVLARETPLEEVKRIKENVDIEIEYFAHGALCVSFSGNCYLSSYEHDASGNRGKCKQLCRLPYSLYHKNTKLKSGYLLSAKDFDTSNRLNELKTAGVDVIKIEGRARRPFYVGATTREYRKLLSGLSADKEIFSLAFNRGFTPGYFDGNGNIISNVSSHIGIKIGKINKVVAKKTYKEVYFSSNKTLTPKSTFKTFFGGKENAVITAYDLKKLTENSYVLTTTANVNAGEDIHVILDEKVEKDIVSISNRVDFPITITLSPLEKIKAEFNVYNKDFVVYGDKLEIANTAPLTFNELVENFNKSEVFNAKITANFNEEVFISKKQLNDFRRNVFDKIYNVITEKYRKNAVISSEKLNEIISKNNIKIKPITHFVFIDNYENLDKISQNTVIYSPEFYNELDIINFIKTCEKYGKKPILDLPNFALHKDVLLLKNIVETLKIAVIVNNYYALNFNTEKIIGAFMNVYNSLTKNLLGLDFLTAEVDFGSKIVAPYMTLRHCPYKNHLRARCDDCPHKDGFYLKMESGKTLKIKRKKLSTCTFYLTD